jgi:hypothetical protein
VIDDASIAGAAAVLEHERIPFVSYPYEWTFAMLRDACASTARAASARSRRGPDAEGLVLVQRPVAWGASPCFIDVGSFERLRPGEPWAGYRQFCMLYLNPLLLQAYKGVDFRPVAAWQSRRHHAPSTLGTCCRFAISFAAAC